MTDDEKHLLVTGAPGVGKTTLIRSLATELAAFHPVGFLTEEMRVRGERQGFALHTLDGRSSILSHVDFAGPTRVGKYGVDIVDFEKMLDDLDLPHSPAKLVIVDEIGKMEFLSVKFRQLIAQILDSDKLLLATVAVKGTDMIEQIKRRSDIKLVVITHQNRNGLVTDLADWIRQRIV